jgi:hypothetical protein
LSTTVPHDPPIISMLSPIQLMDSESRDPCVYIGKIFWRT